MNASATAETRRLAPTIALALLCALAAWPYLPLLGLGPLALDSAEWISKGATFNPNWQEWVFGTRHFGVGYRPVTALSFTLNQALGGFEPAAFRVVDLVLHLLSGLLVYRLYCSLAHSQATRQIGGVVAAAVFLLHPAVQDVLPILARRSYLLSSMFALAGLTLFARALAIDAARIRASVLSGLLLSFALFSNESSAMAIAVVPLVAAASLGRFNWREIIAASSIPVSIGGFAVVLRLVLVGGTGGYAIGDSLASRVVPVFSAAWRSVGGLSVGEGASVLAFILLALLAIAAWRTAVALRNRSGGDIGNESGILLLGSIWLLGATLLYASQGVWYPRQSYLLLAPLALLVGQLSASPTGWSGRLPWIVLSGALLWSSPVVRGMDATLEARLTTRHEAILAIDRALSNVETPARVQLVIPFVRGEGPQNPLRADAPAELHRDYFSASVWLNALHHADDIRIQDFLFYEITTDAATAPILTSGVSPGSKTLRLGSRAYRVGPPSARRDLRANSLVPLERRASDGTREYVLILGADGALLHEL